MRVFEILLLFLTAMLILLPRSLPRRVYLWISVAEFTTLLLHILLEGIRWQMVIVYLMALIAIAVAICRNYGWKINKPKKIQKPQKTQKTDNNQKPNKIQKLDKIQKLHKIQKPHRLRLVLFKIFSMLLLLITAVLIIVMPVFKLPEPRGEYAVSTLTAHFVDESREDRHSKNTKDRRELMATIWYPAENQSQSQKPYIDDFDLFRNALCEQAKLPSFLPGYLRYIKTHAAVEEPVAKALDRYPLLIFSHGMGTSRHLYTSMLEDIASHGYIIVAVDHTYSTMATVFPEGEVTTFETDVENLTDSQLELLEKDWVLDIESILTQLEKVDLTVDGELIRDRIDYERIGVFGHSFGGAAAYSACYSDDRIKAGINLDGSIYGIKAYEEPESDKAFMLMTTDEYAQNIAKNKDSQSYAVLGEEQRLLLKEQGIDQAQYDQMLEKMKGAYDTLQSILSKNGYFISIEGTRHYNFSDIAFLSPLTGLLNMTGNINRYQSRDIIDDYILAFFDQALKGEPNSLLDGPSDEYPQVKFHRPEDNKAAEEVSINSDDSYVSRKGRQLLCEGEPVTLKAINFDNLTWFSETELEKGTPVATLHHNETDFNTIKSYGFNSIRYFIHWRDLYTDPITMEPYEEGWRWLDQNIRWAKEHGIYLILDFHCPYGAFGSTNEGTWPIWTDQDTQTAFVSAWKEIAARYQEETIIAGYDLMNEPSLPKEGRQEYANLLQKTINAIREVDQKHLLILEAAVGIEGEEESWTHPTWVKAEDDNIMYSFHFYEPLTFTHNGVFTSSRQMSYPSSEYDEYILREAMQKFIAEPFLEEYPLFLGEFGCNDWTEGSGAAEWISDVYEIAGQEGIHTALFAYRSFEDHQNRSEYSFAISRMYYNADTATGTEEVLNNDIIDLLKK